MMCPKFCVTDNGIQPLSQVNAKNPEATKIRTKDGITYRKTQNHLKPCQPQYNKDKMNSCDT